MIFSKMKAYRCFVFWSSCALIFKSPSSSKRPYCFRSFPLGKFKSTMLSCGTTDKMVAIVTVSPARIHTASHLLWLFVWPPSVRSLFSPRLCIAQHRPLLLWHVPDRDSLRVWVTSRAPIYPTANDISICVASAPTKCHAIAHVRCCVPFGTAEPFARSAHFVCTHRATYPLRSSCSNNNHHKWENVPGIPKTPYSICTLNWWKRHHANVPKTFHEFRPIPTQNEKKSKSKRK